MILQGPVTYEVDSENGGFLSAGKLTATLQQKGEAGRPKEGKAGSGSRCPGLDTANHPSPLVSPSPCFVLLTPAAVVATSAGEIGIEVRRPKPAWCMFFAARPSLRFKSGDHGVPQVVCT